MDKFLLDTDVILDFFFDRRPHSDYAAELSSLCELKKATGFITPVICSNVYYILRLTAQHAKVIEKLKQLLGMVHVLQMDKDVVMNALNSDFSDFEDALQNFAAIRAGQIDVIITRNIKDYKKSKLGVLTPENYLKQSDL
jgi:predicted nucleic acid-binding protein